MRTKILMITAMLAVMVAMTGIAAASTTVTMTEASEPITLPPDITVIHSVTLSLTPIIVGDIKSLTVTGVPSNVDVTIDTIPTTSLLGPWTSSKTWTVTFTNNGATNGNYIAKYTAGYNNDLSDPRTATLELGLVVVPEFPTVALPIAAVIGLVFFFQHKKKKE